ncbi:hypothetical protein ATI45_3861 [Marinobacter sp. LV10MA510-1]|nr:hypothetical protein ATI45_3861 [Marinobacter sp. LV10MA510-1]PFG53186.1 hypothetical protein ATG98_2269 [Marinobacter sp. LV10R520-4]
MRFGIESNRNRGFLIDFYRTSHLECILEVEQGARNELSNC